jgi:cytochrome b6-f complex iron-sulfur subunit
MDNNISDDIPSLSRRQLLNFMTGATIAVTTGIALYPFGKLFVPPAEPGVGGGILAKDILGIKSPHWGNTLVGLTMPNHQRNTRP